MKWSLFIWKKPVVSSGEPEDYQVVKNTVSQNERNITNINNQLANTVTTNTEQTITGNKNFNSNVVISRGATPLVLKGVDNNKHYLLFKNNADTTTFSLGSNTGQSSFEVNRGDLLIQTQENNKVVSFETSKVNLNRAVLQTGVEINAGFGGNRVKFIPEDTTTKTLQFYNENPGDARRFNLLVPEPVDNNNPATKNYVDNKETAINNQITAINNRIVENNTILKRTYTFTPLDSTPHLNGDTYRYILRITDLPNVSVVGINPYFSSRGYGVYLGQNWEFSYAIGNGYSGAIIYIYASINKTIYDRDTTNYNINFSEFNITVFYMNNTNREAEQRYQGEIVNLEENNEN